MILYQFCLKNSVLVSSLMEFFAVSSQVGCFTYRRG